MHSLWQQTAYESIINKKICICYVVYSWAFVFDDNKKFPKRIEMLPEMAIWWGDHLTSRWVWWGFTSRWEWI